MDANEYRELILEKVKDAWYNYEQAERRFKAAQAVYNAAQGELEKFDRLMLERRLENDPGTLQGTN
jgi:hypothetical protein